MDNIQATGAYVLDDYRTKSGFKNNVKFLSTNREKKLQEHLQNSVCFFMGTDKADLKNKGSLIIHFKFLLPGAQSRGKSAK